MDTEAFRAAFMVIFDRLLDKDVEYRDTHDDYMADDWTERMKARERMRTLHVAWPREDDRGGTDYTNGYLHLIRMFHLGAPELLNSIFTHILENYQFKACNQIRFLMDIGGFYYKKEPGPGHYVPDWAPDLNAWDESLLQAVIDSVIAEENKSFIDLILLHPRDKDGYRTRLAETLLYYMPDMYFRHYFNRLIERSKEACPKEKWEQLFDEFIMDTLAVCDSRSRHTREGEQSFYGNKFKKLFSPEEIETIAQRYCDANKRRIVARRSNADKYTLMRLWDFHPLTRNILRDEFYTQFNAMKEVPFNLDDRNFIDMFNGTEKLTDREKQRVIATLYKKVRDNKRFNDLAKKLSHCLGQKNFQKYQLMES
jgi:hypothetical protein